MIRRRWIVAGLLVVGALLVVSSCSVEGTASRQPGIRQHDDRGVRLPFTTTHPNRWSTANDGTEYEPCTALADDELRRLDIASETVEDAAGTNGQTLRGCTWRSVHSGGEAGWIVSQTVANADSLTATKNRLSGSELWQWRPDLVLGTRTVGLFASSSPRCTTYVQSAEAGVMTAAHYVGPGKPATDAICDRALAFTEATIDQMPE